jgi:hypothetical protein
MSPGAAGMNEIVERGIWTLGFAISDCVT